MQLPWHNMYPQSELDNYKLQVDLLQEKLKQSEENRQQLQKELQQILQRRSEHDKSVRTKIRQKYQSFLDEQERRNERNKMLMQMLERIDQQSAALSARSERLKMMKLQYERYFAKLMQTQTARCIQNTGLPTSVTTEITPIATTQIPVLLPTVASQQPGATILPLSSSATVGEQGNKPAPTGADPTTQAKANPTEGATATEVAPTVLTPRMWTLAMATPTPAGLLLTGAPTAALGGTPLAMASQPYEIVQYPLSYGTVMQQPLQQQQQQQPQQHRHFQMPRAARFRSRSDFRQSNREMNEDLGNGWNGYDDFSVDTRDAATSTGSGRVQHTDNETSTYTTTSQQTDAKTSENVPEHQLDLEIKISEQTVVTGSLEPNRDIDKVITFDDSKIYTVPTDDFEDPIMTSTKTPDDFEETHFTSNNFLRPEHSWRGNGGPTGLQSAEEHKRKVAEIDRKFGTMDLAESNGNHESNEDVPLSSFKPFSEIVNSTKTSKADESKKYMERFNNQPWQSYSNPIEYAPKTSIPNASVTPKPISIDNIENAIYGELVNPQLPDPEAPALRTAAQGFFTELLGQQDPQDVETSFKEALTENEIAEIATAGDLEIPTNQAAPNNESTLGYANYNTAIEGAENSEIKAENSENETGVTGENDPQKQVTYDTTNTELYAQPSAAESAYGTTEISSNYAEYPIDQNIEQPNVVDNGANEQMQEQQQQQQQQGDYTQQGYENYDASQYENYDPNAYPGYIYDENTGQYVVDPQYSNVEGSTSEAAYVGQEYSEQPSQEQINYEGEQIQQVQPDNYTYENNAHPEEAITATLGETDATATSVAADAVKSPSPTAAVPPLEPAQPPAPESTPKVLKPTSILTTAEKHATQSDAQRKKKRVNFVDSSETDDSSSVKVPGTATTAATSSAGATGSESDFDFSSGAETSMG